MDVECTGTIDLHDGESKYKLLFECALDMVLLMDINGNIVDANHSAVKGYGFTRDEMLSMNIKDFRTPGERGSAERQLKEAFSIGAVYETVHTRKDGSIFPVEISSRGLTMNGNKMLLSMVRDITKRKEADSALSRIAAIMGSSNDAILGMTLEGVITDWNHGAEKVYGYSAKEMVGRSVKTLIPQDREGELSHIIEAIKQGDTIEHVETVRLKKDGIPVFVSLNASPIISPKGEILGISWISRDITDQKREHEKIAYAASFPEKNPNPIIEFDDHGTITYRNPVADQLFPDLVAMDGQHPLLKGLVSGDRNIDKEGKKTIVRDVQVDGFYYQQTILYVPETRTTRIYSTNITERKRAEEALETAKASAELYLDLLGHDINNMNQIAIGFLEIGLESLDLTDEGREFLEKPLDTLRNSSKLIDNIRKLQKLEEKSLKYIKTDLCTVLQEVKEDYSHIPGRTVIINFKPIPHCFVVANEFIKDVFANLVSNAIKHSDSQNPLMIDIGLNQTKEKGKNYYMVIVEDNGPGIPDNLKHKLFMRFQRGSTKASGKGLGLYLVRTLVADFHGKVWVEDRVPDDHTQGARFVVMLPVIDN